MGEEDGGEREGSEGKVEGVRVRGRWRRRGERGGGGEGG